MCCHSDRPWLEVPVSRRITLSANTPKQPKLRARPKGGDRTGTASVEDSKHETLVCRIGHPGDVCTEPIRVAILSREAGLRGLAVGVGKSGETRRGGASGAAEQQAQGGGEL